MVFQNKLAAQDLAELLYSSQNKFTVGALKADYKLLIRALKEAHPGLYRFQSIQDFEKIIWDQYALINEPKKEVDFFRIVAPVIAAVQCGHTDVNPSNYYKRELAIKPILIPFEIKKLGGRFFIWNNFYDEPVLKRGTELLEIDGKPIAEIWEQLSKSIEADAGIKSFKDGQLEKHFPLWYALMENDSSSVFQVEALSEIGDTLNTQIFGRPYSKENKRDELLKQNWLNSSSTAYLKVKSFLYTELRDSGYEYRKFIHQFFKKLKRKGFENLIIDLRGNSGGNNFFGLLLYTYLAEEPFTYMYQDVIATDRRYSFLAYTDKPDGRFRHSKRSVQLSDRGEFVLGAGFDTKPLNSHLKVDRGPGKSLKKIKKQKFSGDLFMLIDGGSFSATSNFAAVVRASDRAIFVGEETGGAYLGNNGGDYIYLTLPNTKISITIPTLRRRTAVPFVPVEKRKSGILPDVKIEPTIEGLLEGTDEVFDGCLDLIRYGSASD